MFSHQCYGCYKQNGLGDDILAGNSQIISGLFRNVYGVRPQWNRLMIDPHLTKELENTKLRYPLRGENYWLTINAKVSTISADKLAVTAATPFAVNATAKGGQWFHGADKTPALQVSHQGSGTLGLEIINWSETAKKWKERAAGSAAVSYSVHNLKPKGKYTVTINGEKLVTKTANKEGQISFSAKASESQTARTFDISPAN